MEGILIDTAAPPQRVVGQFRHVGQVANLRADCQSAQKARVSNPRAGWHPAPHAKLTHCPAFRCVI